MKLFLFNPDNDLSLSNGDAHFVPPVSARQMTHDLHLLPTWFCRERQDWRVFDVNTDYSGQIIDEIQVWGWSERAAFLLRKSGVPGSMLPSSSQLETIRTFSHRHTTASLLEWLTSSDSYHYDLPVIPQEFSALEEIEQAVHVHPQTILKAPWSGSGKGLCWVDRTVPLNCHNWIRSVLRRDGSVMIEPVYDKVLDFALLYYISNGQSRFLGYSVFETDERGAYQSNRLLSDASILHSLTSFVSVEQLNAARDAISQYLNAFIAPHYAGYVGIDMMIYRTSKGFCLHPCVEVNLRMTMGIVARLLYNRYFQKEEGLFRILHDDCPGEIYRYVSRMQEMFPPCWKNGILKSGFQLLTEVNNDTRFAAVMQRSVDK